MKHDILNKTIEKFGIDAQMGMAIEEAAEFIQALNKVKRAGLVETKANGGVFTPDQVNALVHLYEEMADLKIMLEQMMIVFDSAPYAVDQIVEEKIQRLADRYDL